MIRYTDRAQDTDGVGLVGAAVRVRNSITGALAPLFATDGVTPITNPATSGTGGYFTFCIAAGIYDIHIEKDAFIGDEDDVTIIDDPSIKYLTNSDATISYGDVVYIYDNNQVKLATNDDTEDLANAYAVCVESSLLNGHVGRFRTFGLIDQDGTPGELGYLGVGGQITENIPDYDSGARFSVVLGRFTASGKFLFNPPPGGVVGISSTLIIPPWAGLRAGCTLAVGSITADGQYPPGDLIFSYNNEVADTGVLTLSKTAGWGSNTDVVFRITKPDLSVIYNTFVTLNQVGLYTAEPVEKFIIDSSGAGSISNSTFRAVVRGGSPTDIVVKSSGVIYIGITTIHPSPYNDPFSDVIGGDIIDYNAPGLLDVVNPDLTTQIGPHGAITWLHDGLRFSFSGYITSAPGEGWAAKYNETGIRYLTVAGFEMGAGVTQLSISP